MAVRAVPLGVGLLLLAACASLPPGATTVTPTPSQAYD